MTLQDIRFLWRCWWRAEFSRRLCRVDW